MNERENMEPKRSKIIKTVFETANSTLQPQSVLKKSIPSGASKEGYAKVSQKDIPVRENVQQNQATTSLGGQETQKLSLVRQNSDAETHHKKPKQLSKQPVTQPSLAAKGKIYLTLHQRLQNYQQRHAERLLKTEATNGQNRAIKNIGAKMDSPVRGGNRNETGVFGLMRHDRKGWLVNPNGTFKKIWETFKFVLLIYTIVYLPMKISLIEDNGMYDNLTMTYLLDKFIDIVFLMDMILTFFTPAMDKHDMATEHKRIAVIYFQGWFMLDLVALIPFEEIVQLTMSEDLQASFSQLAQILKVVRLLRLLKLARLFKSFDFKNTDNYIILWMNVNFQGTMLGLLLPYLALILISAHVYACMWFFLGDAINVDEHNSWIRINKQIKLSSVADQYTDSLYFIAQTFTSVGYGDITSQLNNEFLYRIFAMITGVVIYSLFTGQITNSRQSALEISDLIDSKSNALMRVNSKYQLSEQTILRIMESFRLPKPDPVRKLEFSNLLEQEIDTFEYSKFLQKFSHVKLFSDNSKNIDLVLKLGRTLKSKKFEKDQIIYFRGEPAAIFGVIFSGYVVFEAPFSEELPIGEVRKGFIGEYEIIKNMDRQFTARAAVDTEIFYLYADEFNKIFKGKDQKELYASMEEHSIRRFKRFHLSYKAIEARFNQKLFWKVSLAPFKTNADSDKRKWAINRLTHRDKLQTNTSLAKRICPCF